jgi:Skp family chaperone for outer membrane proteins
MKTAYTVAIVAVLAGTSMPVSHAGKKVGGRSKASPQGTSGTPGGKIAIIVSQEFGNPKTGIKRLVSAYEKVNAEFKPRLDEIKVLTDKYSKLTQDVTEMAKKGADSKEINSKTEEAFRLKVEIERKQQEGRTEFAKRANELTDPVSKEINLALEAYARQRGIDIIFDNTKLSGAMLLVNAKMDLTSGFIADYNSKHP